MQWRRTGSGAKFPLQRRQVGVDRARDVGRGHDAGRPLVLALLLLAMKRRSVELHDGVLDVRAALFRHQVAVSSLDLASARIVDLREHTELRPVLKTGGMSVIGFDAGHFRLRNKFGKAFCLLTDRSRVLWLPYRDGKEQVLLSLQQPQALLDALRST